MSLNEWLPVSEFAARAGMGERNAQRILSRALEGRPWRGHTLEVRKVPSRGGKSGAAFEVLAASLPGETVAIDNTLPAQAQHVAPNNPALSTLNARPSWHANAHLDRQDRFRLIAPALEHPPGSPERAAAIAAAIQASGKNQATVRRWIARYEADGSAGLKRPVRPDAGLRRIYVTRAWDSAVPFDDATKAAIRDRLDRLIASLWAGSTEWGRTWICFAAAGELAAWTAEAGFDPGKGELERICRLGQERVGRDRAKYRAAALYKFDRKRWEDENRYRVERSRAACRPMEVVFGDVHPVDILLPRADGTKFTARLVAFEDYGTGRVFAVPVFPPKGENVRQEHIATAIVAMTQEPGWGLPQTLYIDNGGEYGCVDMVADALALAGRARVMGGELSAMRPAVVRALPYNAAAKSIESLFARLEKGLFSLFEGHIGSNRMAQKTGNVGRAPVVYSSGEAAFREELRLALAAYEAKPQSGQLRGRSPRAVYEAAVAEGWRPVGVELDAILAGFARDEFKTVRQGAFTRKGRSYTAPAIQALPQGTRLHLRVPIFSGFDGIAVMREGGGLLCMAWPKEARHPLDAAGAQEAARGHANARAGARAELDETDALDTRRLLERLASRAGPASDPEAEAVVRLDDAARAVGRAIRQSPAARQAEESETERLHEERRREALGWLLGRTGTDG